MPNSQITNAQLAQKINDLINLWRARELQMVAWIAGPARGGDLGNGTYPLSDYLGNVTYQPSPAQLASQLYGPVADVTAQATSAMDSATTALSAVADALTARDLALSYETASLAAKDLASTYSSAAANSASAALFSQNAATDSAAGAAVSELNATTAAANASASEERASSASTAAADYASEASASAAAAALFDVSNFYTKTETDGRYREIGVALTSSDLALTSPLTLTSSNAAYSPIGGAAFAINNTNSMGQSPLDFLINGSLAGRVRADYAGNMNFVTTGSGAHIFYSSGDSGVGAAHLAVRASGELASGNNVWHTSIADGAARYYFAANSTSFCSSPNGGFEWRQGAATTLMTLNANSGGTLSTAEVWASGGFRWASDTSYWLYNTSGYNYGSWRIGGARNGYCGLALDAPGGAIPTFMATGSTVGVYKQGSAYWSWYEDGVNFHIGRPLIVDGYGAALTWGGGQASGVVRVQNGGLPSGGAPGDICLIY